MRAEHGVHGEALHVIGGELCREEVRRPRGRLIQERTADDDDQAGRGTDRGEPGCPPSDGRRAEVPLLPRD